MISDPTPRLVAFYLPQYHPIPENDQWWGRGFTEWRNVTRAKPNFRGHYQPHVPADLGYYDLRVPEVRVEQAALARHYGIGAFCYYYYWFSGRRVLERPLNDMLSSGEPDFPFCICWANENWTRTWDGAEKHILLEQGYRQEDAKDFIRDVIPILSDPRYLRVDGVPILLIYRVDKIPEIERHVDTWRQECERAGLGAIHLAAVQFWGIESPKPYGFDSAVEFPPHNYMSHDAGLAVGLQDMSPTFTGHTFDYEKTIRKSLQRPPTDYRLFRGLVPSWDNTARRQDTSGIYANASPTAFGYWLSELVAKSRRSHRESDDLIFINAWNELGEGCHLEPCMRYGHAYLEEVQRALAHDPSLAGVYDWANEATLGQVLLQDGELNQIFEDQNRKIRDLSRALSEKERELFELRSQERHRVDL